MDDGVRGGPGPHTGGVEKPSGHLELRPLLPPSPHGALYRGAAPPPLHVSSLQWVLKNIVTSTSRVNHPGPDRASCVVLSLTRFFWGVDQVSGSPLKTHGVLIAEAEGAQERIPARPLSQVACR